MTTDKDVLMRFGVVDHPTTGPALQKLAGQVRSTMEVMNDSIAKVGAEAVSAIERMQRASGALRRQAVGAGSRVSGSAGSGASSGPNYSEQLNRLGGLSGSSVSDAAALSSRGKSDAESYIRSFRDTMSQMTGLADDDLSMLVGGSNERFEQLGRERGEAARKGLRDALSQQLGLDAVSSDQLFGAQGPVSAPPIDVNQDDLKNSARDDAQSYANEYRDVLSQLTGLTDDEITLLSGTSEERMEQLGREQGEAARKGLRDALSQNLGLDSVSAEELFGAQGGDGLAGQQAEFKAASEARAKAIDDSVRKLSELDGASKQLSKNMSGNFKEIAERVEGGASALGQFASGLGIITAGNKNFEQFIKTVLTIKGIADVGVGVVKMFSNLAQGVNAYKERQELANQKQQQAVQRQETLAQATRDYTAVLNAGEQETREMTARLSEQSDALQQVANNAERAAQSTRELSTAQDAAATKTPRAGAAAPQARGGRRGGALGGVGASAANVLGGAAISSTLGSGIASALANIGLDAILDKAFSGAFDGIGKRLAARFGGRAAAGVATNVATTVAGRAVGTAAAGAAGSAAAGAAGAGAAGAGVAGGAAGLVGGAGLVALAGAAAAAAAALGGIGLAAVTIKESFEGTATKVGSVSDTIASFGVRWIDWARDQLGVSEGGFDLVEGSQQAAKADAELKKRQEEAPEKEIARAAASEFQRLARESEAQQFDRRISDIDGQRGIIAQGGADRLNSLRLQQENLGRDIEGEKRLAELLKGDRTQSGQARLAEILEGIQRLERQRSNVSADIASTESAGGRSAEELSGERYLAVRDELLKVQERINVLSADEAKNQEELSQQIQRSVQLSDQLVAAEQEQLDLTRTRADEQKRANEEGIAALGQRLQLAKQERVEAEGTLKSAAERFAQLSRADQEAAKRAQLKADAGQELSDRERGLLRSIGTSRAVAGAELADRQEAERRGFFQVFGQEEQRKVAEASRQEQQLKVDIANKEAINVQIEADYQRMAKATADAINPIINKVRADFDKKLQAELAKSQGALMKTANAEVAKIRTAREAS